MGGLWRAPLSDVWAQPRRDGGHLPADVCTEVESQPHLGVHVNVIHTPPCVHHQWFSI